MSVEEGLPAFVKICEANSISFSIGFDNGNRRTAQGTKLLDVWGWTIKVGGQSSEFEDAEMTFPTLRHTIKAGFRLLREYNHISDTLLSHHDQADPFEVVVAEHELRAFFDLCEWNKVAAVLAVDFEKDNPWRVKVSSKIMPFEDLDPSYISMKEAVRAGIRQLILYTNSKGVELLRKPPQTHLILNREMAA